MKFGLDMEMPPNKRQAAAMQALGYTFCICYIGGDGAAAGTNWHIIDGKRTPVGDIAPFFSDGFMPTYVPGQSAAGYNANSGAGDGADACVQTGACGFDSSSPMFLDIEYDMYAGNPSGVLAYIPEFVRVCNEAGHAVVVYGSTALVNFLVDNDWVGPVVDGVWGADPILGNRLNASASMWTLYDPTLPPPWMFWQCGNGSIAGVSVDYDTATDDCLLAKYAL
jgi:hypothetical protein